MLFKNIAKVLIVQVLLFSAFAGIYSLGQQLSFSKLAPNFYPQNYERIGGWDNFSIIQKDTTFSKITSNNSLAWDAAIYGCMEKHGYSQNQNCYDIARLAFYPAFPFLWRITGFDAFEVSILNFLLFGLSIALVASAFEQKLNVFKGLILISLPGFMVFGMPYTEALFLFFGACGIYAFTKSKFWLAGFFLFLLAITRPAGLMLGLAIGGILIAQAVNTRFKNFNWKMLLYGISFLLATAVIALLKKVQAAPEILNSTDALSLWVDHYTIPTKISGWTYESFALSVFTLITVLIPAFLFLIRYAWLSLLGIAKNNISKPQTLVALSGISMAILVVFLFFRTVGSLHGLFRFTLCSPAFLVLVFGLKPNKAGASLWILAALSLAGSLVLGAEYAGDVWKPEFNGMLLLATSFLLLFVANIKSVWLKTFCVVLVILNLAFNAHLYNMFLSNAWVWT